MTNNHEQLKNQTNLHQTGKVVACGHCQPEKGFDLPEKYGVKCECRCHNSEQLNTEEWEKEFDNSVQLSVWYAYGKNTKNVDWAGIKSFISKAITNERELSEKRGYKRGISDKNVWNGVYNIGAIEERERIVGIIESKKSGVSDNTWDILLSALINQINQGV